MRRILALAIAISFTFAACSGDSASTVANAGDDFSVAIGEAPVFDACESSGEIDNFQWIIVEAPEGREDTEDKPLREVLSDCNFTLESAMVIDDVGAWTIELRLEGEDGAITAMDRVTVTVTG